MTGSILHVEHGVVLTGTAVEAVRYAVAVAQRARARNGLPPSRELARLAAAVAPAGHTDAPTPTGGQPDDMTTRQAARALGYSERTVRRLAPLLGGRLVGGRWLLDRQAVTEHTEGRS